ncbi:MAG: carboxypeptidase-like regulatory domain-containing protein, partial [Bacteroidota bacterium]
MAVLLGSSGICSLMAQSQLRGTVVSIDGDPLVGATVFIPEARLGAYTNSEGIYSIDKITPGDYLVLVMYFGFDTLQETITIGKGTTTKGFALSEKLVFTDEVEITGQKPTGEIQKTEVDAGVISITPREINLIPSVG